MSYCIYVRTSEHIETSAEISRGGVPLCGSRAPSIHCCKFVDLACWRQRFPDVLSFSGTKPMKPSKAGLWEWALALLERADPVAWTNETLCDTRCQDVV